MINVVLIEPEIPQNTGNIMRTCVGINAVLHLIRPFGFSLTDNSLKRYGVNYLDKLNYFVYDDFEQFLKKNQGNYLFFTRYATNNYSEIKYNLKEQYYLFFGKESKGIDKEMLNKYRSNCYRIPTSKNIRSLNLANAVAIAVYDAMRQLNFSELEGHDVFKGQNYLDR